MEELKLHGTIAEVYEAKSGISRNGNAWKIQSYRLQMIVDNKYVRNCIFEVFGEDTINQMNIQQGQELTVYLNIDASQYQGRWYNQIRAWKVVEEHIVTEQEAATAPPEQQQATAEVVDKLKAFNAEPVHDAGSDCNSPEIPF